MGLLDILGQLASPGTTGTAAGAAPGAAGLSADLARGLANAFRSDETPAIGQMVGQLFGQSSGTQQAGLINSIVAALGPSAAASLGGGLLEGLIKPGATTVTPEQASKLSPQQVQDIVDEAHQAQPGLADRLGSFYAEHPTLVKTLGAAALAVAAREIRGAHSA